MERGGRVVRLRHGDPDRMTTYDLEPEAWLERVKATAAQISAALGHRGH